VFGARRERDLAGVQAYIDEPMASVSATLDV
jgi:hypothetical protein